MIARNIDIPSSSTFLFGPRGTGKTLWLKANYPDAIYIDLLDSSTALKLVAQPGRISQYIPAGFAGTVIIDEVQKIPELLDEIHRLIESTAIQFILTGSSPRKLRKLGTNLLAGRALTRNSFPLTAVELGGVFELERSLRYGHLPTLYDDRKSIAPADYLSSYVQTYLKEEILQEGLTRNIGGFTRFLEAASFSQGEVLNISAVAREASITRKVVESYFDILEDLLIATRLPIFQRRAKRRMVQHPKFYFFDVGVYRSIRPKGPLDTPEEIDGAALETLLLQELRAWISYNQLDLSVYYWRTTNGQEVDFILYGAEGLFAIEVKRSNRFDRNDLKGLKAFKSDYPSARCILLYGGTEALYQDQVEIIPIEQLIKNPQQLIWHA
jgi:predicted AAA+ superfamily ATPase